VIISQIILIYTFKCVILKETYETWSLTRLWSWSTMFYSNHF